jgi:hypothetical protein
MRTILAVDELLAHAVRKRLPGEVMIYGHARMREDGDGAVLDALRGAPCVLAIGGARWNPLPWLARWRVPDGVPVIAVVPEASPAVIAQADLLGVPFVVPVDGDEPARRISVSLRRGWVCRGLEIAPVLVLPSQQSQPRRIRGPRLDVVSRAAGGVSG